jgi:hypothetical protein
LGMADKAFLLSVSGFSFNKESRYSTVFE